jgi:hypothetical protein
MIAIVTQTRFTRRELASELTKAGYPIKPSYLAKLAATSGGPPYQRFGKYVTYEWDASLEWARKRLSASVTRYRDLEAA